MAKNQQTAGTQEQPVVNQTAGTQEQPVTSPYIDYDELRIDYNRNGKHVTSGTVMEVVRTGVAIDELSAARLNHHCGNSRLVYMPAGEYKKSDEIPVSVLKQLAPYHNWSISE